MLKQKIMAAAVFFVLITLNVNGLFVLNETGGAFNSNPCEDCKSYNSSGLEQSIVMGAGYFIQSNSDYQLFLKTVEMSGIYGLNNEDMMNTIDNAVKNMELANETYYQIIQVSTLLEYNPIVLEKLKYFNYPDYRYVNRLNPTIFKQVEKFLKYGDVRGCYQRFYTATLEILHRLKSIQSNVHAVTMPEIADCWRLNQLYLETQLFGQYTAEVFMNIQ